MTENRSTINFKQPETSQKGVLHRQECLILEILMKSTDTDYSTKLAIMKIQRKEWHNCSFQTTEQDCKTQNMQGSYYFLNGQTHTGQIKKPL